MLHSKDDLSFQGIKRQQMLNFSRALNVKTTQTKVHTGVLKHCQRLGHTMDGRRIFHANVKRCALDRLYLGVISLLVGNHLTTIIVSVSFKKNIYIYKYSVRYQFFTRLLPMQQMLIISRRRTW